MNIFCNYPQITTSFKYCDEYSGRVLFEPLSCLDDLDEETKKSGIKVHSCFMAIIRNLLSCFGVAFGTTALTTSNGMIFLNNGSLNRFFKRHEENIPGLDRLKTAEKIEKIVEHFVQKEKRDDPFERISLGNVFSQRALGCDRLKKRIDIINEWTRQIRDFVSEHEELQDCFYETFSEKGQYVVYTTVPILEGDMEDPEYLAYVLDRQLGGCKLQFGELIRFIVKNEPLWDCFIKHLQRKENNNMQELFQRIFSVLRLNIETDSYEQLREILADEMEQLRSKKKHDINFIRMVVLKSFTSVYIQEFFTDELLKSVEK